MIDLEFKFKWEASRFQVFILYYPNNLSDLPISHLSSNSFLLYPLYFSYIVHQLVIFFIFYPFDNL